MASSALENARITIKRGLNNKEYTYTKNVLAGYETMSSIELYKKARNKAWEVMQAGNFKLVEDFMDLWGKADQGNQEFIWSLQTQDNDKYGNLLQYYYSAPWYGGSSYYWMAKNLYDSYEEKDERVLEGVFHTYYLYGAW